MNKGQKLQKACVIIIKLEAIIVLNDVTKFYKILIKTIQFRERTSFQTVNFII